MTSKKSYKKAELIDIAHDIGLKSPKDMRKPELKKVLKALGIIERPVLKRTDSPLSPRSRQKLTLSKDKESTETHDIEHKTEHKRKTTPTPFLRHSYGLLGNLS